MALSESAPAAVTRATARQFVSNECSLICLCESECYCLPKQKSVRDLEKKYLSIDGKTLKKSSSVWSFRDYICEACKNSFTQLHSLKKHQKFHCKNLQTEKTPKDKCPKCEKEVLLSTVYKHLKYGCPQKIRHQRCTAA